MASREILLFGGGTYHDFEGFHQNISPLLAEVGYTVTLTYDLSEMVALAERRPALVMLYTCLSGTDTDERRSGEVSREQTAALKQWVQAGGGLLAAHSATVMPAWNEELRRLLGGRFLGHPPQFSYPVVPLFGEHPVTAGMAAFSVVDELYVQTYEADVRIHMTTWDRGVCYPMVWSRDEGRGRVCHVAPGHGPATWEHPAYRQLMRQAVAWLSG